MARVKSEWSKSLTSPLYVEIGSDSAFWFSPEAEALSAAEGILSGADVSIYSATFGSAKIDEYRAKYRLTCEIYASFIGNTVMPGMFECLQEFDVREFSLSRYHEFILSIDSAVLPGILLDLPVNSLDELAGRESELFNSYLGATTFFSHTQKLVDSVFSLAEELRTEAFYKALDNYRVKIEEARADAGHDLAVMSPLEYSDKLLRKNMRRRGPYNFYTFSPTVFSRYRAVRYFGTQQFLFFAVKDVVYDNEFMLKKLKALADDTRFRIVILLKEQGGLQGSEIVDATGLSASTVSHHMKILREAGLVHEEAEGTTKFYSLPTDVTETLVEAMKVVLP